MCDECGAIIICLWKLGQTLLSSLVLVIQNLGILFQLDGLLMLSAFTLSIELGVE